LVDVGWLNRLLLLLLQSLLLEQTGPTQHDRGRVTAKGFLEEPINENRDKKHNMIIIMIIIIITTILIIIIIHYLLLLLLLLLL